MPTARQRDSGFTDFSRSDHGPDRNPRPGPPGAGRTPLGTIYDPATTRQVVAGQIDPITGRVATGNGFVRDPFPGNIIPRNRLDPNAVRLMQLFPAANAGGLINNFATNRLNTENIHTFDVRVESRVQHQRPRVFVRYSFGKTTRV